MHVTADRLHLSPSDVTAFLACEHLTTLSLAHARGELERPEVENEQAELIFRKGLEHERAYLESLRAEGQTVLEIEDPRGDYEGAARATADAIRGGEADVIYQGVLAGDGWRGVADFLPEAAGRHLRGARHEARPLGQARVHPPAPLLQRAAGADPGARAGADPRPPRLRRAGVVPPARSSPRTTGASAPGSRSSSPIRRRPSRIPSRTARSASSSRSATRTGTRSTISAASPGSGGAQIEKLAGAGIGTLAQLASAAEEPVPAGFDVDVWERLHEQAGLQLGRRETGEVRWVIQKPQPESGFALLPDPSPGDLFFDFEGNPFWDSSGGLEYLWGILDVDGEFTPLHAHDHATERLAFETFVDLVHERLARDPDLHVYHYAQYEITALRRLMGRYGTREAELDDLLRRGVFVDLYKVVRNGVRASVPGYGLKELEVFLDFRREAEVKDGGASIVVFEQWMQTGRAGAAGSDRRVQPRGLPRDSAPARLVARAARATRSPSSARSRCPSPRSRSQCPSGGPSGQHFASELLDAGTRARRPAPRLPRSRAEAGVVGVLRPGREDARGAARGSRLDLRARARSASACRSPGPGRTRSFSRRRSTSSGRGRRRSIRRPAARPARSSSSTGRRGGSCSSGAARSTTSSCRKR